MIIITSFSSGNNGSEQRFRLQTPPIFRNIYQSDTPQRGLSLLKSDGEGLGRPYAQLPAWALRGRKSAASARDRRGDDWRGIDLGRELEGHAGIDGRFGGRQLGRRGEPTFGRADPGNQDQVSGTDRKRGKANHSLRRVKVMEHASAGTREGWGREPQGDRTTPERRKIGTREAAGTRRGEG